MAYFLTIVVFILTLNTIRINGLEDINEFEEQDSQIQEEEDFPSLKQLNRGPFDSFNPGGIIGLIPVPNSDPSRCATYEGNPGHCTPNLFPCQNLNNKDKTSCIVSSQNLSYCCPNNYNDPVLPPAPSAPCGDRYSTFTDPDAFKGTHLKDGENSIEELKPSLGPQFFIVGGNVAENHSWPWAVQLYYRRENNYSFICGASIIHEYYVLGAAHCVLSSNPGDFKVKIGAQRLDDSGLPSEVIEVEEVKVHESYIQLPTSVQFDIALFKLKKRISWRPGVAPVCLPTLEMGHWNVTGELSWLIGWGTTSEGGKVSQDLREVRVPIVSNEECGKAYNSPTDRITERQICAGLPEGGKDTCQGDSGGPLTLDFNSNKFYQFGIVSYGRGCAQPNYPGVYTRVTWFLYWLGRNMVGANSKDSQ